MFGPQMEYIPETKTERSLRLHEETIREMLTPRGISAVRCAMARKHGVRITPAQARKAVLDFERRRRDERAD